jgi:hypothetical protein
MENKIVLNFKNIISEMESKELKLIFVKDKGIFIEDKKNNLYIIETYYHGGYIDNFIKKGIIVEFNLVDNSLSKNIMDWKKEIWGVSEVKDIIKRQSL